MVRPSSRRLKKYEKKIDGNIISGRYEKTKDLAVRKQTSYFKDAEALENKVKAICSEIPSIQQHFYIAFAEELVKKKTDEERKIIYDKWKARGLSGSKLNEILKELTGIDLVKLKLYEYCNTGDLGLDLIYGANVWSGQQFTVGIIGPNENFDITSVKIKVCKITFPGHTVNECEVSIQSVDVNGHPTGTILSSGTFDGDSVPELPSSVWKEVAMSSYTLKKSTMYAIVVKALNTILTARLGWRFTSPDTYFGGISYGTYNGGITWDDWDDYDYMFEVWGRRS